ncbi:MAG: hypothetical protein L6Q98_24045 [Anaerolineae bacterium]|nr:hypothetical protein [Anaerolineae bacterium]NUQ06702.1 hypothetical protein [Anaerolineae bacterium]
MSIEGLIVLAAAALGGFALIAFVVYANRPRRRHRRFIRDSEGNVTALGTSRVGEPTSLEGVGSSSSPPALFEAGSYVLSYELFAPTRVSLVARANEVDEREETILLSTGVGLKEFAVENAGQYRWRVEPNTGDGRWKLTVRPVIRRGR